MVYGRSSEVEIMSYGEEKENTPSAVIGGLLFATQVINLALNINEDIADPPEVVERAASIIAHWKVKSPNLKPQEVMDSANALLKEYKDQRPREQGDWGSVEWA